MIFLNLVLSFDFQFTVIDTKLQNIKSFLPETKKIEKILFDGFADINVNQIIL